jgi:hypothetical protein
MYCLDAAFFSWHLIARKVGWDRSGHAFCFVSPARSAGSSLTYAERATRPILRYLVCADQ